MVPSYDGFHELGAGGSDKAGEGDTNLGPWGCQHFYCLGLFNTFCRAGRQLLKVAIAFLGHLSCKEMVFLITNEQGVWRSHSWAGFPPISGEA